MNIIEYLNGFELGEKKIVINNFEFSYVDARYLHNNNQVVRYFIIDVINQEEFENVFDNWLNFSEFIQFERELLEDEFFYCRGDERFNLYLIFIVKKDSKIYKITDISKDFRYARKLIFNEEEAISFFQDIISLRRENNDVLISDVSDRKKLIKNLSECAKYADIYLKEELGTLFHLNNAKKVVQHYEEINMLMEYNRLIKAKFNVSDEKNEVKVRSFKNLDNYQIKDIDSVIINNYRCYNRNTKIPFARVNLIYGENGVGKTSILEAIELGITGLNRNDEKTDVKDSLIEVVCHNKLNNKVSLFSHKNNLELSSGWYGIEVSTKKDFNELFRKWNYFDSSWASTFAIDNEKQVELLERFLGIYGIKDGKPLLKNLYRNLIILAQKNLKNLKKKIKPANSIVGKLIGNKNQIEIELKARTECRINSYEVELKKLNNEMENICLENILDTHIRKIEKIFKILLSSNEYKCLQVKQDEVVAIRNITNEIVPMSNMSTGQKVCLALAFMFSLFLSCDTSPNIIMLDEPVANLDDNHMLNLLDLLKRLALSDTQIFFTTANPDVAKLFRRKFSFLQEDFRCITVMESDEIKIKCETFSPEQEDAIKTIIV